MVNKYTTPSLVEADIRASTAFSSSTTPSLAQVTTWIDEESRVAEVRTNTVFSSTIVSSTYFDYSGEDIFRLPQSPLLSVDKVEYNTTSTGLVPNWVELEEGFDKNYLVYTGEGEIEFIHGINAINKVIPRSGRKRLRVSYTYGYDSTPLEIQKAVTRQVSLRVIESLLNTQANTQGGNIQVGTISVTDPSNYGVTWFRASRDEIDNIYNNMGYSVKTFRLTRRYN